MGKTNGVNGVNGVNGSCAVAKWVPKEDYDCLADEFAKLAKLADVRRMEAASNAAAHANLTAAHEVLKGKAASVVINGVQDYGHGVVTVPSYWFDRLAKEMNGEAREAKPGDVIEVEFEEPLPAGWRRVGEAWFNKFQAKMDAFKRAYEVDFNWNHEHIQDVVSVWAEGSLPFRPGDDQYPGSMFDPAEIIRGQAERIRELEARVSDWVKQFDIVFGERNRLGGELVDAKQFARDAGVEMARCVKVANGFREENERLKGEVADLRAENCELVDRTTPTPPTGRHGPGPCLFAYRRLGDAARQLIWASRRGEGLQRFVDVLDFALDGVAEQQGERGQRGGCGGCQGHGSSVTCGQPCSSAAEPELEAAIAGFKEVAELARFACDRWFDNKVGNGDFEDRMTALHEATTAITG